MRTAKIGPDLRLVHVTQRSGNYEREIFISVKNAILVHMDQKLEILNYINDERLDLLEELAETEATLHETIAALSAGDFSTLIVNYLSVVKRTEDLLQDLDEQEDKVINCP